MSPKFIYVVNFAGVTHVLKVSDKRAASYLDLARSVEDDLGTARDLLVEKGPFLLADNQEHMQQVIEDVSFALKRTITLLRPAKVEQTDGENIQVNTKTPWVLSSDDPKAAATFGRLQLVHQKLSTVIYDLEYIQAAAQLDSTDPPASLRPLSQSTSALQSPVSYAGVWNESNNVTPSTSLSTLHTTPVPGEPFNSTSAPSYASTVSEDESQSLSAYRVKEAGDTFVGKSTPIVSTLQSGGSSTYREFAPSTHPPLPNLGHRSWTPETGQGSDEIRQPPAYSLPAGTGFAAMTNTWKPPIGSNPRHALAPTDLIQNTQEEHDERSRQHAESKPAVLRASSIATPPVLDASSPRQPPSKLKYNEPAAASHPHVQVSVSIPRERPLCPHDTSLRAGAQESEPTCSRFSDVSLDSTRLPAPVHSGIPPAPCVNHGRSVTTTRVDSRLCTALSQLPERLTSYSKSGDRSGEGSKEHISLRLQQRDTCPTLGARDSRQPASSYILGTITRSCVANSSLNVPHEPPQVHQGSKPQSGSISQAVSQKLQRKQLPPESKVRQVVDKDDSSGTEQRSEICNRVIEELKPGGSSALGPQLTTAKSEAGCRGLLQPTPLQTPGHTPTVEQHPPLHKTHNLAPNYEQPARTSRFRDADMNRDETHDSGMLPYGARVRFFSMSSLPSISHAPRSKSEFQESPRSILQSSRTVPAQNQTAQPRGQYRTLAQLPSQTQATGPGQRCSQQVPVPEGKDKQKQQARVQFSLPEDAGAKVSGMSSSTSLPHSTQTIDFAARPARLTKTTSAYQSQTQKVPALSDSPLSPALLEKGQKPGSTDQDKSRNPQSSGLSELVFDTFSVPSSKQLSRHSEQPQHFTHYTSQVMQESDEQRKAKGQSLGSKHAQNPSKQDATGVLSGLASLNTSEPPTPRLMPSTTTTDSSTSVTPEATRISGTTAIKIPPQLTLHTYLLTKPPAPDPPNAMTRQSPVRGDVQSARPSTSKEDDTRLVPSRPSMDPHSTNSQNDSDRKRTSWAKLKTVGQAFKNFELRRGGMDRDWAGARNTRLPTVRSEV